jgi:Arc/MetJ-type ribon-helix-helix transcriptional regulator
MVMDTLQIRLSRGLVERIDALVKKCIYANRSDAIRDAVRSRFWWQDQIGTIKDKGDSVKQIRKIREKLSKEPIDLDEINSLLNVFGLRNKTQPSRET